MIACSNGDAESVAALVKLAGMYNMHHQKKSDNVAR
jgi:hypothetical protein